MNTIASTSGAAVAFVHMPQAGLRGQERTVQVDCQHLLPLAERKLVDWLDDLDAGIADKDVHPAETFDSSGNACFDGRLVAHVHGDAHRGAAGSIDFIRGCLRRRQLQVGDHDFCALHREALGDLFADAARRAGDDGNLAAEMRHGEFLSIIKRVHARSDTPNGLRIPVAPFLMRDSRAQLRPARASDRR
jgi:hypothetical protein